MCGTSAPWIHGGPEVPILDGHLGWFGEQSSTTSADHCDLPGPIAVGRVAFMVRVYLLVCFAPAAIVYLLCHLPAPWLSRRDSGIWVVCSTHVDESRWGF
jgi:hypothetical protein